MAEIFQPQTGIAINNAILDPLQGFDADVWIVDQATGNNILVGRFTSFQLTIRNSTEPYLEMNQRIPRYLDGEIQIGWVCERGLLDARIIEQTFGFTSLSREARLNRQPRFNITVQLAADELDAAGYYKTDSDNNSRTQGLQNGIIENGELFVGKSTTKDKRNDYTLRKAKGELNLQYCRLDSFTMGIMAGRSVIANRWEGLAEGIQFINRTHVWAGTTVNQTNLNNLAYKNIGARLKQEGINNPAGGIGNYSQTIVNNIGFAESTTQPNSTTT